MNENFSLDNLLEASARPIQSLIIRDGTSRHANHVVKSQISRTLVLPGTHNVLNNYENCSPSVEEKLGTPLLKDCATFELFVKTLVFSEEGIKYITSIFKNINIVSFKLCWKFLSFDRYFSVLQTCATSKVNFYCAVTYKIKLTKDFYNYAAKQSVKVVLLGALGDKTKRIAQAFIPLRNMIQTPMKKVELIVTLYKYSTQFKYTDPNEYPPYGTLSLWYKLDIQMEATTLLKDALPEALFKDLSGSITDTHRSLSVDLSGSLTSRNDDDTPSIVLPGNPPEEVMDKSEWLNQETDWRKTLQEYAILSGKDPNVVDVPEWRDEQLRKVKLRRYSNEIQSFDPKVIIKILSLELNHKSPLLKKRQISQVFIEYTFLGCEGRDMETECALWIKGKLMEFNYKKIFNIHPDNDIENCILLTKAIRDDQIVRFNIVKEPVLDPTQCQVCEEIGFAEVKLFELVQEEENRLDLSFAVKSTEYPLENVGILKIAFKGIQAMRRSALNTLTPSNFFFPL